ncbi:uncharacterized protein LOC130293230 [Hyla sarda]|uniref:uncharacterized protein LOC130293230 n=1 Tax=Hyla sarda TaxID=327740 RepID=UPI0024C3DBCA|nr:uncharacterized protein LOC130293230 [Hyla sarda]
MAAVPTSLAIDHQVDEAEKTESTEKWHKCRRRSRHNSNKRVVINDGGAASWNRQQVNLSDVSDASAGARQERPQGVPVMPGDPQQPPVLGDSSFDPPYEDACDNLGPQSDDLPPLDATASSPLLFVDNMRQVSSSYPDNLKSAREYPEFGVPLSAEKTEDPSTIISFLGIEIDSVAMVFRLPAEKLEISGFSEDVSGCCVGRAPLPPIGLGPAEQRLIPLVESSLAASTWAGHDVQRTMVYFLGHSYFHRAAQRADCRPGGRSLGCGNVEPHWRGIPGMRWTRVLTEVVDIARTVRSGVILVVHAGGNDLCYSRVPDLITLMKADVERFSGFFPDLVLVWSEIVPRVSWQGARNAEAIERSRRLVNSRMARFVRQKGGVVVRHRELEGDNRRFMISDGVHLNDIGLDIFLSGLQDGLEQALFLLGGGRSTV